MNCTEVFGVIQDVTFAIPLPIFSPSLNSFLSPNNSDGRKIKVEKILMISTFFQVALYIIIKYFGLGKLLQP
ncbi:MAG: hypothetical protein Ct9H300mP18_05100 [Candidatus Neomarinimicrobiota bacterium]|nr:MAG: hypothetical protein Ct9H300mP18_05100 [Candidatus Neomarinimicrobiota bacterium]